MWHVSPSRICWLLLAGCLVLLLGQANAARFAEEFAIPILADNSAAPLIGVVLGSVLGGIALARPMVRRLVRPIASSEVAESRPCPADRAGRDARIVRRIGRVAKLMAGSGVVFGLAMVRLAATQAAVGRRPLAVRTFLLPVVAGVAGYSLGRAGTCAIAPASFLTGPAGRPHLERIGTSYVLAARVACVLFGLVLLALSLLAIGLLLVPPLGDDDD